MRRGGLSRLAPSRYKGVHLPASHESSVSKTPGFLFEVPDVLLQGGRYIPLPDTVVLPGGAAVIHNAQARDAAVFEELAARDEIFTVVLMRAPMADSAERLELHEVGALSLIADHRPHPQGGWLTIIAGIGRVRLGEPYLIEGDAMPRVDVEAIPATCEDLELARRRLRDFSNVAMGLGAGHSELVSTLHRYAQDDLEPSLSVDRLAGLVATHDAAAQQRFLEEPDVMARLDLLDAQLLDYMARVKGADLSRDPDGELD